VNGFKFLHVGFRWHDGGQKIQELEAIFNTAQDWIRYAPNCWIVYTTDDAEDLYERVRHLMTTDDRVLVCELNPSDKQGWLENWMWERLNPHRSQ
jgi:hypothetical protein